MARATTNRIEEREPLMTSRNHPTSCRPECPQRRTARGKWGHSPFLAVVILAAFFQSFGLYDYGVRFHADGNSVWSLEYSEPIYYLKLFISMAQETLGL